MFKNIIHRERSVCVVVVFFFLITDTKIILEVYKSQLTSGLLIKYRKWIFLFRALEEGQKSSPLVMA